MWAAVKGYLEEVTAVAAAPVIEKYTGVLWPRHLHQERNLLGDGVDQLDLGYGSQVYP